MPTPFVYDPSRPDFQTRAHAVYRVLRDEHPVYAHPDGRFWALSRYADVRAAASDPASFSSEGTDTSQGLLPMIQALDPPRHDRLRALVSKAFTPRRVADLEPAVRRIARELLDAIGAASEADLLADFARHLPSRVIGALLGVPEDRRERFLHWTEALVTAQIGPGGADHARGPAVRIYREFAELLAARRAEPRDDLMSALLAAEVDGARLSEDELLGFCFVLIVAGNDTTTNLVANGLVLLADHPDQRKWLVDDPRRLPNAIEEMLRCEAPAQALPRIVRRPVALHGRTIPAGALVRLVWGAANRDEREFPDAERFDVARPSPRHLAFGQGLHFCLGANLARLEARVAFEEVLARWPEYALRERPGWLPSIWARAHDAVPVRLRP